MKLAVMTTFAALSLVLLAASSGTFAAPAHSATRGFDTGPLRQSLNEPPLNEPLQWQPQVKTLTLSGSGGAAATGKNKGVPPSPILPSRVLRLRGSMQGGWHYMVSQPLPLQPRRLYRFSVWLRVDKAGPSTPMPFLQCAYLGADSKSEIGWANTQRYGRAGRGRWQHLEGEFQAPPQAAACRLSLETGTLSGVQIDAVLAGATLQPIARLSAPQTYRLLPPLLQRARGRHPRLFFGAGRAAQLRRAITGTHRLLWEEARAQADKAVAEGPPPYNLHDYSGERQESQGEVGNTMCGVALAYLLTGETRYLDGARAWALASCAYPTWGLGKNDGMDLAAGHQLFGLALVYDWCYDGLGEAARRTIRQTLSRRASAMFTALAARSVWWHDSYLQNHLWVNICGLMAAGLALFDEVDEASAWAGLSLDKFRRTLQAFGPDGASHEGVAYWGYGIEQGLKIMHLARDLLGVNLYGHAWWRNTASYGRYLTLPRRAWTKQNSIVNFADSPRRSWCGPDYLLRALAAEYRDPHAQWLAAEIDRANIDNPLRRWHNLLWFDASVPALPPDAQPTLRHFADMGIVSARSGWSGDESLLAFKCGPFIGHHAMRLFDYDAGGGHVHPDANHFVLFGAGEWLLRDDGYGAKWTGRHNTLLIGGSGQIGEGGSWFKSGAALEAGARPRVLKALSSPSLDHVVGDATEAYPRASGLQRYRRHLLFLKPDTLIVLDDIALERSRPLELRFHPEVTQAERDGAAFVARGKGAVLRLESLAHSAAAEGAKHEGATGGDTKSEGAAVTLEAGTAPAREGTKEGALFAVRCKTQGARWRHAMALSWSKAGAAPPLVTCRRNGDQWRFTSGGRVIVFHWPSGAARLLQAQPG